MSTINPNSYTAFFIDEQSLKDNSLINENVDVKMISPTIRLVQDVYLYKILGSSLYTDLQNKIVAKSLNPDELFLMQGYIAPVMIWGIMVQAPMTITYKYSNKGVQTMNSDNSNPASLAELQALQSQARVNYDLYVERLVKYLIAYQNLFPTYRQITALNDVYPATTGYKSRLALGNMPYNTGLPTEVGGGGYSVNLTPAMFTYLNTNVLKYAVSHSSNVAIFSGSFLPAPNGIPYTSVANFSFYVNSGSVNPAGIISFVDNGNTTCTLQVDTTTLGYSFQPTDQITSIGKYK
jgi:hypothetical protein